MNGPLVPGDTVVIDPQLRQKIFPRARELAATLSSGTCVTDGRAFVEFLDQRPSVDTGRKIGIMGYCMPAEIEVYAGALHGWCPPDSAVYNRAQAERAWRRVLALFECHLV